MSAVVETLVNRSAADARVQGAATQSAALPAGAASATKGLSAAGPRLPGVDERAATRPVTQPVLFKRQSGLAAFLISVRAAAPAALASLALYASARLHGIQFTEFFSTLTVLVTVLAIFLLQPAGNAEPVTRRRTIVLSLLVRWCVLLAILVVISFVTGLSGSYLSQYPGRVILTWAVATPPILIAATLAIHEASRRLLCTPGNSRSVVFAGCSDTSFYLAERFAKHPELCMSVRGFFDDRSAQRLGTRRDQQLLGHLADLPAYVKQHGIDVIFIALPLRHIRRVQGLLDALGDTTVSLYYVPDVFVSDLFEARAGEILGVPVIAMRETPFHGYRGMAKRLLDIVVSSTLLIGLAPLFAAIAIGIKLTSRGPVIFRQHRYGLDGREIVIYKFRTMRVQDDSGWVRQARRDDERITPLGRYLRRSSLDEFPQLMNVLQGRMSLVGPRPHAVSHNEEYRRLIKGYMMRHKVPPGITGLAQVNGLRGETRQLRDMQRRVQFDLEYARNWSLWLDIKILALTLPALFRSDRAY